MVKTRPGVLRTLEEQIIPGHTALVIVDVQNDFVHPDGFYGKKTGDLWESYPLIPRMLHKLPELLSLARSAGALIVYVQAIYDPQYLSPTQTFVFERQGTYGTLCQAGTFGAEFFHTIAPLQTPREIVVSKHRFSGFWGTDLGMVLRSNEIKTVMMTGTVTSGCVEATARDAMFNDFYVVTVEDCCADKVEQRQAIAMQTMEWACGFVVSTQQVAEVWSIGT